MAGSVCSEGITWWVCMEGGLYGALFMVGSVQGRGQVLVWSPLHSGSLHGPLCLVEFVREGVEVPVWTRSLVNRHL